VSLSPSQGHKKSQNNEGIHRWYKQYNISKINVKKKDEQNDELYEWKHKNLDTKDTYLEMEWKVVLK
jgi:hypothetical protein